MQRRRKTRLLRPNNGDPLRHLVTAFFVSDLHLDASRPEASDAFCRFLQREAVNGSSLYILGDLFEYWIGDDEPDGLSQRVVNALRNLSDSGTRCYVMHGNRDFLLGSSFVEATGATLLFDPTLIYAGGQSVLISHGDALCTDDLSYQRFRRIVRNPTVQKLYLALPRSTRRRLADRARTRSRQDTRAKAPEIMDVNQQAVERILGDYAVTTLLHGHTHRPGIHRFSANGADLTRIVLGDWYQQGSVLRWDESGPQLQTLEF